jgi:hypothetical protein
VLGGVAVKENEDPNLPGGGAEQGGGDDLAGLIAVKNIRLEMDGVGCLVDQLYQRRKVIGAAVDEADFVMVGVSGEQSGRSSCRHRSFPSVKKCEPGSAQLKIGNFYPVILSRQKKPLKIWQDLFARALSNC